MSIIATALKHLIAAGVSGDDLVRAVAEMEAAQPDKKDEAAERRRENDRIYQSEKRAERRRNRQTSADSADGADATPLDDIYSNPPETPQSPKGDSPKPKKASRLPDDFVMPSDWKDWARETRGWAVADIETEAANFCDYWQARGAGATKRDWRKAWQTWVRNSKRPDGQHRNDKPVNPADRAKAAEDHAARLERIGRAEDAAEIRRQWSTGPPRSIGELTSNILGAAH